MKKRNNNYFIIGILAFILTSFTVIRNENIKDYLSIGENLNFNTENYKLKWSSNPSSNYYKQEYLRKDDNLPKYEKMVVIEAIKGKITVKQASNIKINELKNWEKRNPIIKYQKFENKDKNEIIIDFILSDRKSIYEWNVYRYQEQKNKTGNYMVLYSYSYRNYISQKKDVNKFLDFIKETRIHIINKVGKVEIPKVETE